MTVGRELTVISIGSSFALAKGTVPTYVHIACCLTTPDHLASQQPISWVEFRFPARRLINILKTEDPPMSEGKKQIAHHINVCEPLEEGKVRQGGVKDPPIIERPSIKIVPQGRSKGISGK